MLLEATGLEIKRKSTGSTLSIEVSDTNGKGLGLRFCEEVILLSNTSLVVEIIITLSSDMDIRSGVSLFIIKEMVRFVFIQESYCYSRLIREIILLGIFLYHICLDVSLSLPSGMHECSSYLITHNSFAFTSHVSFLRLYLP